MPLWKTQLVHFHKWNGHYMYGGRSHACSIVVHSVQDEDYGGAVVSFAADNTRIAMSGKLYLESLFNTKIAMTDMYLESIFNTKTELYEW